MTSTPNCCFPHKQEVPWISSNMQMSCINWAQDCPLHPTQYQMFILLCQCSWGICSPHISAHNQTYYQGRCQFMHSINSLKLKRTATLWVGQCLKRWNLCRKMKTFRKLYSPTHAYSLMSPFMESPYWLNPPKYLYGIWVTATLALTLYAVGFFLLFYLWWHIKTIEKCENNAKNQPEKGQRWLNNRGKKKERKIAE